MPSSRGDSSNYWRISPFLILPTRHYPGDDDGQGVCYVCVCGSASWRGVAGGEVGVGLWDAHNGDRAAGVGGEGGEDWEGVGNTVFSGGVTVAGSEG